MSGFTAPHCGSIRAADDGREVELYGWVARRRDHGGLIFIDLRDRWGAVQVVFNPTKAPDAHARSVRAASGVRRARQGRGRKAPGRFGEPAHGDRRGRGDRVGARGGQLIRDDAVSDRGPGRPGREDAPGVPLSRPAPAAHDADAGAAQPRQQDHPRLHGRARVHRGRDADPDPQLAVGRARLPGPVAPAPGLLLRAAASAADAEAAADGVGRAALLPDRSLLPRREPASRPPAGVHAARPRDVVLRRGGRLRPHRGPVQRALARGSRRRAADSVSSAWT